MTGLNETAVYDTAMQDTAVQDTAVQDTPNDVSPAVLDAPPPRPAPRNRGRDIAGTVLPPVGLGFAIVGLWYGISYLVLDDKRRFLLRPPHQVIRKGFLDRDTFGDILGGLWSSARVAGIGLAIAIVLGMVLATIMSQTKLAERAMFPYLVMLQAIPILAITPLIMFWFGTGQTARVIVCVIIALFPIIVNTLFGLQSAERDMHDLFSLHHASRVTRLRKLMFPAALPAIFAGLRISAGLSVIGAIVGDFFFGRGDAGIGQQLRRYASQLDGEELLAAVIMSSALGVVVFLLFGWLQHLAIGRWHEGTGRR
jgi:NitT/TauT family transport system permease protein